MLALRELQERFFATLVRPHGTPAEATVVGLVEGRGALGSDARLEIYARMYCARIIDALAEDFPRLAATIGAERFDELAHAYLARWPSTHPSLRHAGRHVADFLGEACAVDLPPFVRDLARLEWMRLEVFDARDALPLTLDDLRAVAPQDWGAMRLRLVPAIRVLDAAWPVHEIWATEDAAAARETWRPAETHLRVWRKEFAVYQAAMDDTERTALAALADGASFADVCERLARSLGAESAAAEAAALVLRWVEDGILAGPGGAGR
jgi:hypothetical protein